MSISIHIRIGIGIRINIRINTAVEHPVGSGRPLAAPPREWALIIPPSVVVVVIVIEDACGNRLNSEDKRIPSRSDAGQTSQM